MTKITKVQGTAVAVVGNDIDTDRIIPARFLKEITFNKMGDYPFFDERFAADGSIKDHPFNKDQHRGASILIANSNFGCGSSREHAPQSLVRWGIKAIVAESYAEIFAGNCIMLGTPVVVAHPGDVLKLQELCTQHPDARLEIDLETLELGTADFAVPVQLSSTRRNALMEGSWDSTSLLVANAEKVRETAAKLPYMQQ